MTPAGNANKDRDSGKESLRVFVAFDDSASRERASAVCDHITARFWPDIELELHWCELGHLGSPEVARQATDWASDARIIIVASSAREDMPEAAECWLDEWCMSGRVREGALIGLIEDNAEDLRREAMDHFLRKVAHRAGLDYLTRVPETAPTPMPDETGWLNDKAEQMSTVLDGILATQKHPHITGL